MADFCGGPPNGKNSNSNENLAKYEDHRPVSPYVCTYGTYAAIIHSWMTGCKSLVVDCDFGIRLNGVKTKPIRD